MSEFDALLRPAEPAEEPDKGPLVSAEDAAPPLSDEEHQAMEESLLPASEVLEDLGVLPEPVLTGTELRLLQSDVVPIVGTHYVVWGDPAMPLPVLIGAYRVSEDDHAKSACLSPDPVRNQREEKYARWRYRGYLAGQVSGL